MQAVLLTFKYFQRANKNKFQQQSSSTQIFNGRLKSDSCLRLAGGCQELLRPQTALYALLHGEGSTHIRAVGVNEQAAGGTWMWAGATPAPAAGSGCLRGWSAPRRPARALPVFGRGRQRRPLMCTSAGSGPEPAPVYRQAALLYRCTICSSTVPTDCTVTVMQRAIKRLCAGRLQA